MKLGTVARLQRLLLALSVVAFAQTASASTLTLDLSTAFSGGTPAGPAPWVRAIFDDTAAQAGYDVRLTIETLGLSGSEFITETDFNVNSTVDLSQLTGVVVSDPNGVVVTAAASADAFKADGDGYYDLTFDFSSSPPRATGGMTYVFDLNLVGGTLTASDFNFLSLEKDGGDAGPFYAAAHVQGIDASADSSWIADSTPPCVNCGPGGHDVPPPVPEPATLLLLGSGLIGAAAAVRSRRRKA